MSVGDKKPHRWIMFSKLAGRPARMGAGHPRWMERKRPRPQTGHPDPGSERRRCWKDTEHFLPGTREGKAAGVERGTRQTGQQVQGRGCAHPEAEAVPIRRQWGAIGASGQRAKAAQGRRGSCWPGAPRSSVRCRSNLSAQHRGLLRMGQRPSPAWRTL